MLQVRATATRPMLVGHNTTGGGSVSGGSSSRSGTGGSYGAEVKVFTELQISLFPEEKHTVQVQLSADVASFLNAYFFPAQSRQAAATLATLRGPDSTSNGFGGAGSGDGLGSFSGNSGALSAGGAAASDRFLLGNRFAMGSGSSLFGGSAVGGSRELAPDSSSDDEHEDQGDRVGINNGGGAWNSHQSARGASTSRSSHSTARNSNSATSSSANTSNGGSSGSGGAAGVEVGGVYLKYFRIGEVELALTTVGFGKKLGVQLDRDRLRLTSPAFHRSERVVTWKQVGQKYVKHLVAHLVTGGAGTRQKSLLSPPTVPLPSPTDARPLELTSTHDSEAGSGDRDDGSNDEGGTLGPSSNRHFHRAAAGAAAGGQHSSGSSSSSSSGTRTARKGGVFGAASSMLRAGTSAAAQAAAATAASTKSSSSNKADKSREALLFGGRR